MTVSTRSAYLNTPDPQIPLDVVPVGGRIGAEVRGVALSADLPPETLAAIRAALVRHKVLFFRGQHHLDDAGQEAFGQTFGTPFEHPTVPSRGNFLFELDSHHGARANHWHTDITFVPAYPFASILRGVTIPPAGGDTVWANTVAAYQDLPEPLRELADGLRAIHTNAYDYAAERPDATEEQRKRFAAVFARVVYETEHPVVRVHPESGERTLLLGGFVKQFVGLPQADSKALYDRLQSYVTRLENSVRWRWREGDVAIWDNRATQHYAIDDYGDQHRVVRRVTLAGDVPVGVDGQSSRAILPAPEALLEAAE
ncbi:TauD/TfdA family dioxygenase [Sphingomonas sp. NIBR02145]|uniref:TauD/TfdA dioxygenase family protein n=1 Tax=Sphingomonas sp. NIBR02145 TaxID=3014784 RepID=UPI0022B35931|nr:TauD/TfdA family dioxygenase [Sphingomonas sp. NIBR02145]WHU04961.1 TauD/TfdA family dioxygenase [Sphingomonas sp. NIBR02145]